MSELIGVLSAVIPGLGVVFDSDPIAWWVFVLTPTTLAIASIVLLALASRTPRT